MNPERTVEVEWNGARYLAREDAFGVLTIPAGARPLSKRATEAEKHAVAPLGEERNGDA